MSITHRCSTSRALWRCGLVLTALLCAGPARAEVSDYWAFRPPAPPPAGATIDSLVRAKLREKNLVPAPPADRIALLRRVYFDLVGLPPSPAEIEAFTHDQRPDAYEREIERLLVSPQYGERWGRHWLDVVRYADTGGFENDLLYEGAWRYRDYVIGSFNTDKPFDRFIKEQVAGDELYPDDPEAVTATAMFCVGPTLPEAALNGGQLEYEWLTDCGDTVGAAFLGLTLGCARCHNHKYDPLTQADYFGMQAIFAASDRPFPEKIRQNRIKGLNGLPSDAPIPKELLDDPRCTIRLEKQSGFWLFHREQAVEVRRLQRGELSKPREVVTPALPVVLVGKDDAAAAAPIRLDRRRAALAEWLASPKNPLTARVIANRVWGWHFGQGIVRTANDFGKQGEPPTHPELLDYLANELVKSRWSIKRLHRLILLSDTYRQSAQATGPPNTRRARDVDAHNRLLWHFPRNRLDGECIRDAMLFCSGTLNSKAFGPPVVPPLGPEELTGLFDAKGKWPVTKDASEHSRRSVYLLVRRTFLYPMFAAFDPPEVMSSCPRRFQTTVPTQALTLLNSPVAREQAAAFAMRLIGENGDDAEKIIARAWLLAFGRPVTPAEVERSINFLKEREAAFADRSADQNVSLRQAALTEFCLALFNSNEFVEID
jgi:hypothetical protein